MKRNKIQLSIKELFNKKKRVDKNAEGISNEERARSFTNLVALSLNSNEIEGSNSGSESIYFTITVHLDLKVDLKDISLIR